MIMGCNQVVAPCRVLTSKCGISTKLAALACNGGLKRSSFKPVVRSCLWFAIVGSVVEQEASGKTTPVKIHAPSIKHNKMVNDDGFTQIHSTQLVFW